MTGQLTDFISYIQRTLRKSVSLGNDLRLESEKLTGSGLEFEDHILQLTVFYSENAACANSPNKMRRASARRESRTRQ
ncbi:MAG: hypothetical protein M1511_10930 [Deltaproteobacteria bacterium]|nr:hypothetical protein [Deltaproteobacteria bacterium]